MNKEINACLTNKRRGWRYCVGIDPGAGGAMAVLPVRGGKETLTPVLYDFSDKEGCISTLKLLSLVLVGKTSRAMKEPLIVFVETAASRPGQGVVGVFSFGQNYGTWLGRLEMIRVEPILVHPRRWQNVILKSYIGKVGDDTKKRSIHVAKDLFPEVADQLTRKKDHGRSDALLIAEYGRRWLMGLLSEA